MPFGQAVLWVVVIVFLVAGVILVGGVLQIVKGLRKRMFAEPLLEISQMIALRDGYYSIKVVSYSGEQMMDVRAELIVVGKAYADDDSARPIQRGVSIPLVKPELLWLEPFDPSGKKPIRWDYRFRIKQYDLDDAWASQEQFLRFKVRGTLATNGVSKGFKQEFKDRVNCIASGTFLLGADMVVRST